MSSTICGSATPRHLKAAACPLTQYPHAYDYLLWS